MSLLCAMQHEIDRSLQELDKFMLRRNIAGMWSHHRDPIVRHPQPGDAGMRSKEGRRNPTEPKGELALRTLAMPADCNPKGDIFGGWIMALMDSAGKMSATPYAG